MSHTIKLAPMREGFYCPLSGLNLSIAEPQATISEAAPISRPVQLAISLGSLIDVTGNYPKLSDSTITSAMIADGAVTVDHIEDLVALYAAAKAASEAAAIPSVTGVAISGSLVVGQVLTLGYTFVEDTNEETESGSTFVWSIADTVGGTYAPISGATAVTYTIVAGDIGKFITGTVTPRDEGGESGVAVTSAAVGPIPSNVVTVTGVTVQDVVATGSGTTWAVELPFGTAISENPADVEVTTVGTTEAVFAADTWTITVTAADEVTTATVTVDMTVAAASTDVTIESITVQGVLATFTSGTAYAVTVTGSILETPSEVVVVTTDENAVVSTPVFGTNTWTILVTAEDGTTTETYTVAVTLS